MPVTCHSCKKDLQMNNLEGCGLLVNKNPGGGGGLTWADCDDEEDPVLIPVR